ncbi:hypothetical protein FQR65_LT00905 [Abscondita terminalis]|nr:hypothetical protein FQR65_LT00905 [Abscondita terminalis]
MSILEENLKCCVQNILETLNVFDYVYETSIIKNHTNFIAVMKKISVRGKSKYKDEFNVQFMVKIAPLQKFIREGHHIIDAYVREAYVYEHIFPSFAELEKSCGVDNSFRSYPNYYASSTVEMNEFIVLEDMTKLGYSHYKVQKIIDLDHAVLIIRELGKFHAMSFALRKKNFDAFCEIRNNIQDFEFHSNIDGNMESAFGYLCEISLGSLDPLEDKSTYNKFVKFQKKIFTTIRNIFKEIVDVEHTVITHGDFWLPNLLFKYQDGDVPSKVCMLDWQYTRIGSPAFDISQFLFNCCDNKIRNHHYTDLIQDYYQSLSKHLRLFGEDASDIFPYNILMNHLKKYSAIGLLSAIKTTYIMSICQESDLSEVKSLEEYASAFFNAKRDTQMYNRQMKNIIMDYVKFDYEEASWVVSVPSVGIMAGSIAIGFLIDRIGRKKLMMLGSVLLFVPWILTIFAKSFVMLLVARIFLGLGVGIGLGVIPLYIGEIAEKEHRGTLCSLISVGKVAPLVIVYSVGPFVSFVILGVVCAIPSALFLITCYFIPDSPYYLIKVSQRQAAYDALKYLNRSGNITERLEEIEKTVQNDIDANVRISQLLLQKNYRKSFLIVIALKTLQQFSGLIVISAYLQTIMKESETSLSEEMSSVIFAAIQIPCVFVSSFLCDKLGRRPLLIISSSGCALSLAGEGLYFYLQAIELIYRVHIFLPYVALGELFTPNMKKVGGTVYAFYAGLLTFTSNKIFNPIVEKWGMYVVFWAFAGVCVLGVLFGLFVFPETKGKTFDEIQEILNGNKKQVDDSSIVIKQKR